MNELMKNKKSCLNCVNKFPYLSSLSENEIELFNNNCFELKFKKDEVLQKQGTPLSEIIFICSGIAKLYLEGNDNKSIILRLIKPGDFISGPEVFVDQFHHFSLKALSPCKTCCVGIETFKKLFYGNSFFKELVLKQMNLAVIDYRKFIMLQQYKMNLRLAYVLVYLSENILNNPSINKSLINRKDLADLSGIARENVGRTLKQLEQSGYIRQNGDSIELLKFGSLKQLISSK